MIEADGDMYFEEIVWFIEIWIDVRDLELSTWSVQIGTCSVHEIALGNITLSDDENTEASEDMHVGTEKMFDSADFACIWAANNILY
jgi:hypothetical protein